MQNNIIKVKINIPLDYVIGHLCYGHKEGILEFTEEEFKKFKEDPINFFIEEEDFLYNLKLIIDDYDVDDYGSPLEVNYEVIDEIK